MDAKPRNDEPHDRLQPNSSDLTSSSLLPIYLDHHATTPVDPSVARIVLQTMTETFGNPNSIDHVFGDTAAATVDRAREDVAALLKAPAEHVRFTSGATEAIRIALGIARANSNRTKLRVAVTRVEHSAVLESLASLEQDGLADLRWIDVDTAARVSLGDVQRALAPGVDLLCLMAANNEVGTLYPIREAAILAHEAGAAILVDATQALGRVPLHAEQWDLDYLVISAHKLYGPKGVGALIGPQARSPIANRVCGHEGTPNVPGAAGLGAACRLFLTEGTIDEARIAALRDRLEAALVARVPGLIINGDHANRLSNNLHVSAPGAPNDAVVARTPSTGRHLNRCSLLIRRPGAVPRITRHGFADRNPGFRPAHFYRKVQYCRRNRPCRGVNCNYDRRRSGGSGRTIMAATQLEARPPNSLRFSGHETFACRYAWLPKAYRALQLNSAQFGDENGAMVELGLGKNMVRSLRFWVEASGLATPDAGRDLHLTDFAHAIFGKNAFDPYLEDVRTLWLLHWNLASRSEGALFAWRYLMNDWPHPEFARSEALAAFQRESTRLGHSHSAVTLTQHLDVFIRTYLPSRSGSGTVEDSLDGPLVELALLQAAGERKGENGRWETVYSFRREPKPEVTSELFAYCLADFWNRFRPNEETLTLREVAHGACSPGQIFKLPEEDIRARLEAYAASARPPFIYQPSAVQALISKKRRATVPSLAAVYDQELTRA